jgi:tRNA modification GTPase
VNNIDTIVSIATPMGTGALSIIRCSGNNILDITEEFFKKKLTPRYAHYLKFQKNNIIVDDVVAIYYVAPKSYTGEDMLEIMCHGGSVMYQLIINEILKIKNCRLAKAGEFTERAFLNNKMSLMEAESICALINSKTEEAAMAARESLSGKLTQDILKIDGLLLQTRIQVEALLDFSDEDIETEGLETIEKHIEDCKAEIINLIKRFERNRLLFETSKIAVIGKPNTGKSSLINYLTNEEVSIVNTQAGTTRDVVSKMFSIDGAPVTIFDTAGIRETDDPIEKKGKEKAFKQAESVNIILYLYDINTGIDNEDFEILENLKQTNKNIITIGNKTDLLSENKLKNAKEKNNEYIYISIKKDLGTDLLKNKILESLKVAINESSPGVSQLEHIKYLNIAYREIDNTKINIEELEIIAEKLKKTQESVSRILDNNDDDRVLSGIFSNFCIGK